MAAVFILFQSEFFSVEIQLLFPLLSSNILSKFETKSQATRQFACKLSDSEMVALKYGAGIKHDMEVVRAFAFHRCGLDSTIERGTVVIFSK